MYSSVSLCRTVMTTITIKIQTISLNDLKISFIAPFVVSSPPCSTYPLLVSPRKKSSPAFLCFELLMFLRFTCGVFYEPIVLFSLLSNIPSHRKTTIYLFILGLLPVPDYNGKSCFLWACFHVYQVNA